MKIFNPNHRAVRNAKRLVVVPLTIPYANKKSVYVPHPERPKKTIKNPALEGIPLYGSKIRVNFNPTQDSEELYNKSKVVMSLGLGLEGWFLITGVEN